MKTLAESLSEGWMPLTYPYTDGERPMMMRALDQLNKGQILWRLVEETFEGVTGVTILTKPELTLKEDV